MRWVQILNCKDLFQISPSPFQKIQQDSVRCFGARLDRAGQHLTVFLIKDIREDGFAWNPRSGSGFFRLEVRIVSKSWVVLRKTFCFVKILINPNFPTMEHNHVNRKRNRLFITMYPPTPSVCKPIYCDGFLKMNSYRT